MAAFETTLSHLETTSKSSLSSSSAHETDYDAKIFFFFFFYIHIKIYNDNNAKIDDDYDNLGLGVAGRKTRNISVENFWDDELEPYQDEPSGDKQWLADYERRRQKRGKIDEQMQHRFSGDDHEVIW